MSGQLTSSEMEYLATFQCSKKSEVIRVDDRDDLDWIQGKGGRSTILRIVKPRNFRFPYYTYFSLKNVL